MPGLLRGLLGFIILVATIGLATCQSVVRADPYSVESLLDSRAQVER